MTVTKSRPIDSSKVLIVTPTHDGNVCSGYAAGLATCAGLYGALSFIVGNSHVALARNCMAAAFLSQEKFEWMIAIDADIQFSQEDMRLLQEGDELLVCAEYAKKDLNEMKPAQFGLGFTLIHRDVFARLKAITVQEEGPHYGAPLVGEFIYQGRVIDEYFPSGMSSTGHWMGEDHGFFGLCRLAGIKPRLETRARLVHWGRLGYRYEPSPSGAGKLPVPP
jgi:hypothetical protein